MAGAPGYFLFTLTGKDLDSVCTFRILYARAWEFTGWAEVDEEKVNLIEIPVTVLDAQTCNPGTDSACLGEFPAPADSSAISLVASAITALSLLIAF